VKAVVNQDILATHRKKNKANHPPDERQLLKAAQNQVAFVDLDTMGTDADDEEGSDEDEEGLDQRARRHSKSMGIVSPTSLKFYEGSWAEALKMAKLRFRRYVIIHNGFSTREEHLQEAAQIIARVIEDMKHGEDGVVFDPGMCTCNSFVLLAYI
jgi:hypothetical protein